MSNVSTNGIGCAIACGLVEAGAKVWFHGRNVEGGARLAQAYHGRFVAADLARPEEIQALVETVTVEEERLDILVNNAGTEISVSLYTMPTISKS